MNIFVLDTNVSRSANMLCLKHLPKLILETAQLLSNCWTEDKAFYRRTHYNHPCSKWARETKGNYNWLLDYGYFLALRYTNVYGKVHKCAQYFDPEYVHANNISSDMIAKTPFVQCMPDKYKGNDPVEAYRKYYKGEKLHFSKWEHAGAIPNWLNIPLEDKYKFVRT